jgi:hypothetical protein
MQVQVAVHPGGMPVLDVHVKGGGLDHAGYDLSEKVSIVQVTPTQERLTITIQVQHALFLPIMNKLE